MSSLVDWEIEELCFRDGLVFPYSREQLNPASYDVLLGREVLAEAPPRDGERRWSKYDLEKEYFLLAPGEFVLASTFEVVRIPDKLEAIFCLKSSRGREGYDHALAAYIDPGFKGRVTLELHNMNRYNDLKLVSGMRIGQLRFSRLATAPARCYDKTGRYHGDMGPQPSRG